MTAATTLVVEVVEGQCPLGPGYWSRDCTAGPDGRPCPRCDAAARDKDAIAGRRAEILAQRRRTALHYRQWIYTWGLPRLLGVPAVVYVPMFLMCMLAGAVTADLLFRWVWGLAVDTVRGWVPW